MSTASESGTHPRPDRRRQVHGVWQNPPTTSIAVVPRAPPPTTASRSGAIARTAPGGLAPKNRPTFRRPSMAIPVSVTSSTGTPPSSSPKQASAWTTRQRKDSADRRFRSTARTGTHVPRRDHGCGSRPLRSSSPGLDRPHRSGSSGPAGHRRIGRRPATLATLFGEVPVVRDDNLVESVAEESGHCPADAAMGREGFTTAALALPGC